MSTARTSGWLGLLTLVIALAPSACTMIGPDYVRPEAPTGAAWIETENTAIRQEPADYSAWWSVFGDPVLDQLVEMAYRQNPSLRSAGVRVLEAQARRGVAIGGLFPQHQEAFGAYTRTSLSTERANQSSGAIDDSFSDWQIGFDAAWELDFWGRFRRGIESADAELLASVAAYDDALVSLVSEVAANYILLRTFEERLQVARDNVEIQQRSFDIADARFRGGAVSQLDSEQAASLLESTRSRIPALETQIRQVENTLCVLLGIPPQDLEELLGGARPIPSAPSEVAVGIPADLLRRRPDVRQAERVLAAQSARIGVAKADLLPRFILVGDISFAAEDLSDLFTGDSFESFGGPTFRWAILNYGRIINNVRVQDAEFQALIGDYENTVLRAQADVEDAIAGFLGSRQQVEYLGRSVDSAARAVELADLQYREGAVDYTRVLNTQQSLLIAQELLVDNRGDVALQLTALYKALGGGWEQREGRDFVPEETRRQMRERTYWGGLLDAEEQQADVDAAASGTETERGWWRWRRWWPKW
jgi:NodT family efflux transporter outer membrane factor (OMF) lipoprotein